MTLKLKSKIKNYNDTLNKDKKVFGRNCILYSFITRKFEQHGVFLWIKDPNPGDPKRPDPTGSGSATLATATVVSSNR